MWLGRKFLERLTGSASSCRMKLKGERKIPQHTYLIERC